MLPVAEKPVFDREGLLERLGGDTELLDEVLGIFLDECQEMLANIRAAVTEADGHRVERAAHSMKGALLNISAEAAADRALRLEQVGSAGELELCPEMLAELEEQLERLRDVLLTKELV
jgi:HPt (histidine-containing phosphotransfer) domain-containing protein